MIDLLADALMHLSHTLGGSLGFTIVAVSLLVRLAWMPLGVRFAVQARRRALAMEALKPELDALREAHPDPLEQLTKTHELYAAHGLTPSLAHLAPLLVQAPVFWGLFATVRRLGASGAFLWIPNLARPDLALAAAASMLVGLAALVGAETPQARMIGAVGAVVFFVVASRMAASIGLLMATSAGMGVLQSALVRRQTARA
ncbi:MAG: YidC/Oxa1 family membrane protein insertase [Myxococcota bacterium]